MTRLLKTIPLLAVLIVAAVACGGSSSSSSVSGDDVAVVNGTHITKDQLDQQIALMTASAKAQGQSLPAAGTTNYKKQVIDVSVQQLVQNAEVEQIAQNMNLTVTDADVKTALDALVTKQYGGDQAKFQKAVKKYGYTPETLNAVYRLGLLEQKITAAVTKEVTMTPAQVQAAYTKQASTFGDARNVHYMLWPSKESAQAALSKMNSGTAEKNASTGSIDSDTAHGTTGFAAASGPGLMDVNFQKAAFKLPSGAWGTPVPVDANYAKSSLAGKCKPTCYFLINPMGPVAKAGSPAAYKLLKAQIDAKLNPSTQSQAKVQAKIQSLLAPIKKKISYADGYAPPAASTAPTTTSSSSATS